MKHSNRPPSSPIAHAADMPKSSTNPDTLPRRRCIRCARIKKGCDGARPCGRCVHAGLIARDCVKDRTYGSRAAGRAPQSPQAARADSMPLPPTSRTRSPHSSCWRLAPNADKHKASRDLIYKPALSSPLRNAFVMPSSRIQHLQTASQDEDDDVKMGSTTATSTDLAAHHGRRKTPCAPKPTEATHTTAGATPSAPSLRLATPRPPPPAPYLRNPPTKSLAASSSGAHRTQHSLPLRPARPLPLSQPPIPNDQTALAFIALLGTSDQRIAPAAAADRTARATRRQRRPHRVRAAAGSETAAFDRAWAEVWRVGEIGAAGLLGDVGAATGEGGMWDA